MNVKKIRRIPKISCRILVKFFLKIEYPETALLDILFVRLKNVYGSFGL